MDAIFCPHHNPFSPRQWLLAHWAKQCWSCACDRGPYFCIFLFSISECGSSFSTSFSMNAFKQFYAVDKRTFSISCLAEPFQMMKVRRWPSSLFPDCAFSIPYENNHTYWSPARQLFEQILAFSQDNFQPASTHHFIMSWVLTHFVFDRREIKYILPEQQALGAHTDIIQFQKGNITVFRWTHAGARPMGVVISKQCPNCKKLKTRSPVKLPKKQSLRKVLLRCSSCQKTTPYELPSEWKWVDKPALKGDNRGAWIYHTAIVVCTDSEAQPSSTLAMNTDTD